MDPEIKRRLDDQLASGEQSPEDHDEYQRKLEALQAADVILAQATGDWTGTPPTKQSAVGPVPTEPSSDYERPRNRGIAVFLTVCQLALLVTSAVLISKLGQLVPLHLMLGYLVGAVVGFPTFLIGCYRKSKLASTSWWAAMMGGALSLGLLSFPIAIYFGYRIIRHREVVPSAEMQPA
ncbi:hypothetical protein [Prosthecobacter vanneervenii]|uniref:Putative YccA/Bax inhibitor family protein n=1 Tax=Prosthecobacter vanneervenii TaxID=48466 RepID=A0A7W7Y6L1_9BACT|nr:hypothetical protein [Prosthecobacter vanneervenii]MBB5030521.1 putative YccA/Bax inhibitor family protein [Prosthecobacter vanneervenii]